MTVELLSPRQFADLYAATPNRGFLYFTMMDSTQHHFIYEYFNELSQLTDAAVNIATPGEHRGREYKMFQQMYWFRKGQFRRAQLPFLHLYSAKGHVTIDHDRSGFDRRFLKQAFRLVADHFHEAKGPATQSQLDRLKKEIENSKTPRRGSWPERLHRRGRAGGG